MSSHDFHLAASLLDEAAHRLQERRYGTARVTDHNHGAVLLTSVHRYSRAHGHQLTLFAADSRGQAAVVEAHSPSLRAEPSLRIRTVRAAHLTFYADTESWTFHAHGRHHYTLTTRVGESRWSLAIDEHTPTQHDSIDTAIDHVLSHEPDAYRQLTRSRP
ncbi:hypothetical protein [Mycolicibacterium houstonense]|uniref:hypothetical protein n=1 Tax=Mycolicibacterium houstonense TaxID=146021 RepID=UPI003F955DDE